MSKITLSGISCSFQMLTISTMALNFTIGSLSIMSWCYRKFLKYLLTLNVERTRKLLINQETVEIERQCCHVLHSVWLRSVLLLGLKCVFTSRDNYFSIVHKTTVVFWCLSNSNKIWMPLKNLVVESKNYSYNWRCDMRITKFWTSSSTIW